MTKIVGVIGNPIEHSMSPAMHNAAFLKMGVDFVYLAFRVTDLKGAVKGMRALGIRGYNVTIPFKVDVMKHLDEVDPLACKIGAVNTVVNDGGVLTGYNTDCSGAVSALEGKIRLKGKKVMVLGAGGAARAVAFGVADKGADVVVVNRSPQKGMELTEDVNQYFKGRANFVPFDGLADGVMDDFDVLVNTTSVGMYPDVSKSPVKKGILKKGLVVMDVVYNPIETRLLSDAKSVGCVTIKGIEMFVNQGALAFELFIGKKAPKDVMRDAVLKMLPV
ncbi:MAG: shikimate dehydrogenase [archaeon]